MEKSVMKDFATLMAKLKRDTINFKNLNISKSLVIQLNDETTISYNLMNNHWCLRHSGVVNDNWDPTFNEVLTFIEGFQDFEVLLGIQKFEEDTKLSYESITAIALFQNVMKLIESLKFEENAGKIININDEYIISVNNITKQVMCGNTQTKVDEFLDDIMLNQILVKYNYYQVITALNKCYTGLLRKN